MKRALITSAVTIAALLPTVSPAQQPVDTIQLNVTGGSNDTRYLNRTGPTPFGVYIAGNPILGYCDSNGPPECADQPFRFQSFGQIVVSGETVRPDIDEKGYVQHFYVNTGGQNPDQVGKLGLDTSTVVRPTDGISPNVVNAPKVWAKNANLVLLNGARPQFAVGSETNITNESGFDCSQNSAPNTLLIGDCHLNFLLAQGTNRSTTGILMGGSAGVVFGIDIQPRNDGDRPPEPLATRADIRIQDSAPVGLLFQREFGVETSHSTASIEDFARTPSALLTHGPKTVATFRDLADTPSTLLAEGTKTTATINLADTAPVGVRIAGTHQVGISTVDNASDKTLNMRPFQSVCWNLNACISWSQGDGYRFTNTAGTELIARIDPQGNLLVRGTVTQNVQTGAGL